MTVKAFVLFPQVDPQQASQVERFLLFLHLNIAQTSDSSSQPRNADPGAASDKFSQTSPHPCPDLSTHASMGSAQSTSIWKTLPFIYSFCRSLQQGPRCYYVFIISSSFSPPLSLHSSLSRSDRSCVSSDTDCKLNSEPLNRAGRKRTHLFSQSCTQQVTHVHTSGRVKESERDKDRERERNSEHSLVTHSTPGPS